jgi:hypothetical protein
VVCNPKRLPRSDFQRFPVEDQGFRLKWKWKLN